MASLPPSERSVFLSVLPASTQDRRFARLVVLVSLGFFLLAVPFAKVKLDEVWAFIPSYQSALLVNDLITAVLLFAQLAILRSPSLLVLAAGYLFSALAAKFMRSASRGCSRPMACSVAARRPPPGCTWSGMPVSRSP